MQLRNYWKLVRRYRWLITGFTLLITAAIAFLVLRIPNYYDARARVEINPEGGARLGSTQNAAIPADPAYLNTQLQMITSAKLLRRVAKALDLEHEVIFRRHMSRSGRMLRKLMRLTYIGKTYDDEFASPADLPLTSGLATANSIDEFAEAKRLAPYVGEIRERIKIEPIKETRSLFRETRLVDIIVRHQSPKMAARLANAIADELVIANNEQMGGADRLRAENLTRRAIELQAEIRKSEARLGGYAKHHEILSLEPGQNTAVDRLVTLNRQLLEAENGLRLAEADYQTAMQPNSGAALAQDNIKGQVSESESKVADLRARRAQLMVTATDKWPEVREVTRQIESLEDHVKDVRKKGLSDLLASLSTKLHEAQAREQAQRAAFERQRSAVQTQNDASIDYRLIQQEIETNKRILNGLLESLGATEALKAAAVNNLQVVDYALTPDRNEPQGPMRLQYILIASFLALGLGLAGSVFLGHLDDTLRSDSEVRSVLNSRTLGYIGSLHRGLRPMMPRFGEPNHVRPELLLGGDLPSPLADDYRRVRTSIIRSSTGRQHSRVLITSSVPGEGKTTTAINLAVSFAQNRAKVLLIDADLRRPGLHAAFGLENTVGLASVLSGGRPITELSAIIQRGGATGVDVLCAGPEPSNPAELLGSETMMKMMESLQNQYEYVILDSPAVECCVDALLLVSRVDGVVMVVQSGKSSRETVRRAWQSLDDAGAPMLGVVLNRGSERRRNRYVYATRHKAGNSTATLKI